MIGVDTSTIVAFLQGEDATDVEWVVEALKQRSLILPPFVVTELFSAPKITDEDKETVLDIPQLPIKDGFWERAGRARLKLLNKGYKARTLDSMIAVYCLDHDMPLISRDDDYRHFAKHCKLKWLS